METKPLDVPDLPEGVKLFPHQASGHHHGKGRLGIGVLKHKNGDLLKPMLEGDRRSALELSFYKKVFDPNQPELLLQELRCFLPEFHGTLRTKIGREDVEYLCLEDICKRFDNPSILDLKMGRITYDADASPAKIKSQSSKYKFGAVFGFRIGGMKVYDYYKKDYLPKIEKSVWKQVTPETIVPSLKTYLTSNKHINKLILSGFIHKLERLSSWFSRQRLCKFIGSSLLFAYEGSQSHWAAWCRNNAISVDCSDPESSKLPEDFEDKMCNLCFNNEDVCDICGLRNSICSSLDDCDLYRLAMIDFSHCFPFDEEDTNYTYGLHKLIDYLKELIILM